MYAANRVILKLRLFGGDVTSDYAFLFQLLNTLTVDTEHYYPRCYKVNDAKTFKNPVRPFYALSSQFIYILTHLNWAIKNHVDLVLSNLIRRIFICKGPTSFQMNPVNIQSRSPKTLIKRTYADMELGYYPKV